MRINPALILDEKLTEISENSNQKKLKLTAHHCTLYQMPHLAQQTPPNDRIEMACQNRLEMI